MGQILLTHADLDVRPRFLNACHTFETLLALGVLPIVNENDSISVEEIRFGDNDTLAAQVAQMVGAGLIIILSDVDGFYSADPKKSPDAQLIPRVDGLPDEVVRAAEKSANPLAHGGMVTKLKAVRVLNTVGIAALVVRGRAPRSIERAIAGEALGTLFVPDSKPLTGRKGWIGTTATPKGWIRVDEGAVTALAKKGKSLLPSGVLDVNGKFQFGDLVELRGPRGAVLGRGLVNYSAKEIQGIAGKHTREIVSILGHKDYDEIVHRNNMVLIV